MTPHDVTEPGDVSSQGSPTPPRESGQFHDGLPRALTPFIGREREVEAVLAMVRDPGKRIITLTGPGGVGKTRLALRAGEAVSADFQDGAVFVSLASLLDPALVGVRLTLALGINASSDEPLTGQIARALGRQQILLLVDNFEHVVEAAPFLVDLVVACPGLTLLVTSRVRLRISGEHQYEVSPLNVPDASDRLEQASLAGAEAIRLFVTRAQAVQPNFALTDENAADVVAVCRRLDGLPLAIELAAARVNVLPPRAMLTRLDNHLPLLTGGGRDMPERQRTMRDTIAWSYGLLQPSEQALFRRLAVFIGGVPLSAVEPVADVYDGPDVDTFDGVAALVDHCLIRQAAGPDGEPRYWMLETVREYALEQLAASGEESLARARHAEWYLAFARVAGQQLWRKYDPAVVERLESDLANLRAAFAWYQDAGNAVAMMQMTAALGYFLYLAGHYHEGIEWMERALAGDAAPSAERARTLLWAGVLAIGLGEGATAIRRFHESAEIAQRLHLADVEGVALLGQGIVLEDRGQFGEAERLMTRALDLFRQAHHPLFHAQTTYHLGMVAYGAGAHERARELWEATLHRTRELDEPVIMGWCLELLALQAAEQGDVQRAAAAVGELLEHFDATSRKHSHPHLLATLAVLGDACQRHVEAARLLGAATAADTGGQLKPPPEGIAYERAEERLRAVLGPDHYEHQFRRGHGQGSKENRADARSVLAAAMSFQPARSPAPAPHGLTPREIDVLRLMAAGYTNEQIGEALYISPRTAQTHVTHLLAKLGMANRTEAAAYAHHHHLV